MRKIYQKSTKIRMLAVRSQENSFEFFELEEDDIRRLNLNGNFHINDFVRITFNVPIQFIDSQVIKLL